MCNLKPLSVLSHSLNVVSALKLTIISAPLSEPSKFKTKFEITIKCPFHGSTRSCFATRRVISVRAARARPGHTKWVKFPQVEGEGRFFDDRKWSGVGVSCNVAENLKFFKILHDVIRI